MARLGSRFLVLAFAFAAFAVDAAVELDAGPDRVKTPLRVDMKRIGTIRPRPTDEIKSSNWTIGCETLDRDFADFDAYKRFLKPLGIKKIRLQAGWAKCEKEKGRYDFSWLDRQVDFALENGIVPMLETGYGNPVYPGGGGWDLAGGFPTSEDGLAGWDAWVDAISRHFATRVRDWAMWNEPDYGRESSKTPADIATFNVRTAKIIRRNIPGARIAGLSLARNDAGFLEECLKAMGPDVALFDSIIYHGYASAPESSYAQVEAQKAVLARYNPSAKMRQGENGCPSEMCTYFALSKTPWSEYSQAKWDMRRMLGDLGHDVESSVFTICDFNHKGREINRKGLLRANAKREVIAVKRAYYAVQNVASVFDDTLVRVADSGFGTTDETVCTYEYRKDDGARVFAFWTCGSSMIEAGVPACERPGDGFATRPYAFYWTGAPLKDPVWVDLLTGAVYEFPRSGQLVHSDGVTFVDVPVYDSPCLLTERRVVMHVQQQKKDTIP